MSSVLRSTIPKRKETVPLSCHTVHAYFQVSLWLVRYGGRLLCLTYIFALVTSLVLQDRRETVILCVARSVYKLHFTQSARDPHSSLFNILHILPPLADIATLAHYHVASTHSSSWCYWCILATCPALQKDWRPRSPGGSGLAFIKEAIALPCPPDLTLYVRSPSKLPPDIKSHAHVVTGSLSDKEALTTAMDGIDTIVSVLVSICSFVSVNWGWTWY